VSVFADRHNDHAPVPVDAKGSGDILQQIVRDATETGTSKNESDGLSGLIFDNKRTPVSSNAKLLEELSSKQTSMVKPECSQTVVEESEGTVRHVVV